MNLSPGVFKELYRGYTIHWNGDGYTVGGGSRVARSLPEARSIIDQWIAERDARDRTEHDNKLAAAKAAGLWARRDGDTVILHTPDGVRTMSIRQYRNEVFNIEERYNLDVVFE